MKSISHPRHTAIDRDSCGRHASRRWSRLLFPLLSAAALLWFVARVIPKPIRATYPCQRAAFPFASAFVIWLLGLKTGLLTWLDLRGRLERIRVRQIAIAGICLLGLIVLGIELARYAGNWPGTTTIWTPTDPPNSPMGEAKGIFPGRVVWAYDPALAKWNGSSNYWWQDKHTDPTVAQAMMSRAIRGLVGQPSPAQAWDAIFRHFNQTHGFGDVGYQPGEKIAIKVNNIFSRTYAWNNQKNRPSPQMVFALISQLVNGAGVADTNITVYDCIFYHGDPVYTNVHAVFPGVRFAEGDATDRSGSEGGPGPNPGTREKVLTNENPNVRVYYGNTNLVTESGQIKLPTVVTEAKYLINFALPRWHELAGVTACAKNFFGSVWSPSAPFYHGWNPQFQHNAVTTNLAMGSYSALVDLLGHEQLGGKTMLFLVECIYQYDTWNLSTPPFTGPWVSSLWVSEDPVAIDSVMVDFLRSFVTSRTFAGSVDNYLHEAAQANDPPSHTVYDPENDGTALQSLGVHEHWNNAVDKQYSRNLATNGTGIELVQLRAIPPVTVALVGPTNGTRTCPGANLILQAAVTTNFTWVQRVEFYRSGVLLGSCTNEPFNLLWTGVPAGDWALTALATTGDSLSATSAVVNINVSITNLIVKQPESRTNYVGTTASFSVTPNDCCPATAQWFHGDEQVTENTNFNLALPEVQPGDAGEYTVTLSSGGNSVTSAPAALVVLPLPRLEIALETAGDTQVRISWPADAGAFSLHAATNLTPPVEWSPATNPPVLTNGQWVVRLPLTNRAARFYRLQTP